MSDWPKSKGSDGYTECVEATCPSKHRDLDAKCYAQDNIVL